MGIVNRLATLPRSAVEAVLRRRAGFPGWLNRAIDRVAERPDGPVGRLAARTLGPFRAEDVPVATEPPFGRTTVYIGPTNYAGQGREWARALGAAGVAARNMAVDVPGGFSFPADSVVPVPVYNLSESWQQAELEAVSRYTHVLVEAERPLFGRLLGRDPGREAELLAERGVSTAYMCHGSDVRLPSRHRDLTPWSPFRDPAFYTGKLERDAVRNIDLLARLDRPTFVSTPDLLKDVPAATWCPVVVDLSRFAPIAGVGERSRPVVVHTPSKGAIKGTQLIEPAMHRLHDEGVIEYLRVVGVSAAQIPGLVGRADIVLDQFRLGSYGVAACEAMAAGRPVVGHVVASVRDEVRRATGRELPIVEATPDTVEEVIRGMVADLETMRATGESGRAFAREVHDGRYSAQILLDVWIRG